MKASEMDSTGTNGVRKDSGEGQRASTSSASAPVSERGESGTSYLREVKDILRRSIDEGKRRFNEEKDKYRN